MTVMKKIRKMSVRRSGRAATPLLAAMLIAAPPQALAQTAPNAGTILQEVRPTAPAAPSSPGPVLTLPPTSGGAAPTSAPFLVRTVRITGATLIDGAILHGLVADAEGQTLTLSQISELADRITAYYRAHDFPLAKAIIPPQEIRDGEVVINVVEARYGAIGLNNSSRVHEGLLRATLAPLESGDPITQSDLDHSLLLLSDIPGVAVGATLGPGASVGTSDLTVDVAATPQVAGNVTLDNYGDRYTGRVRLGGTVHFFNPLRGGDVLSLSGLTTGEGLNYARIAYEAVVTGGGDRIGASYSALHYVIGDSLAALDAEGDAQVASLWASHPFIRSRDLNLYGRVQYDWLTLSDRVDVAGIENDRHLGSWTLSLAGDRSDDLGLGGVTSWDIGWTHGTVDFDNAAAEAADAATAQTAGDYSKWSASVSRLQRLSDRDTLYLAASGQWADTNLDSAEKMIAGGAYTVRAYDVGALSGDTVYLGTAELRHDLGVWRGEWQAFAFVDSAHVTLNEAPWAPGDNDATLTGAGLGLNWRSEYGVNVTTFVAARIGDAPDLLTEADSVRVGIAISAGF